MLFTIGVALALPVGSAEPASALAAAGSAEPLSACCRFDVYATSVRWPVSTS